MLNSATDYKCVIMTNLSSFVSGDILPVRDKAADDSWRRLKYEDYLFLLEARYERERWDTTPSATVSPKGRLINRSHITATQVTSNTVSAYINKDMTIPTGLVSTNYSTTIMQAMNAAVSLLNVSIGRNLNAETMRKLFWNVSLLKRGTKTVQTSDIASSWTSTVTYTQYDGSSSTNTPVSSFGTLWSHGNASRVGSAYSAISISYKASFGTFPYASAAWLFLKIYSYANSGGSWYDIVAVPCTVTNGIVAVPSLAGIAPTVCSAHGLHYTAAPSYITSGGGNVIISSGLLVVENNFPAEIDSLNWDWSPT